MRRAILNLCVVLFAVGLWAQAPHLSSKTEAAIAQAKNVLISNFDSNLPHITLEYFLQYEGAGLDTEWRANQCRSQSSGSPPLRGANLPTCIQVTVDDVHNQRTVTVVVEVRAIAKRSFEIPTLHSVTMTDENGVTRPMRLIDVPAALHGRWPKRNPIHDLPPMPSVRAQLQWSRCIQISQDSNRICDYLAAALTFCSPSRNWRTNVTVA